MTETTDVAAGWEGILEPGETILWQGRPDGAVDLSPAMLFTGAFGLVFSGFAVFWMAMAARAGGLFWMFGLIHFFVGLAVALGPVLGRPLDRRHTYYTLTNRRAFIAKNRPILGKTLASFPITADTPLDYRDGDPGSLYFATRHKRTASGSSRVHIGFERIFDAADVFAKARAIQRGVVK
ncbi:MAG: aspartate carbamoyltransferase catalytic subunit [Roseivivax sp.]|nr:aspartate carbamoyltransferase catalytic subunit [Roseivivax sp.]